MSNFHIAGITRPTGFNGSADAARRAGFGIIMRISRQRTGISIGTGCCAMAIRTGIAAKALETGFNSAAYAACRTIAINPTCIGGLVAYLVSTSRCAYAGS